MKTAATLKKGLDILEVFTIEAPRLKLQEISKKTGMPTATAYRLLRTLMSCGYIRYDQRTAEFYLGTKLMSLGLKVLSVHGLRETAYPHLEKLSKETDQNVNLGILDGANVVYIERIIKRRILNLDIFVGSRINTFLTACGRAILAYLDDDKFQTILQDLLTLPDVVSRIGEKGEWLIQRISEERAKGYTFNDEELIVGMRAAGVPIFNAKGKVEAAINITAFSHICSTEAFIETYVTQLLETARNISQDRGYQGALIGQPNAGSAAKK